MNDWDAQAEPFVERIATMVDALDSWNELGARQPAPESIYLAQVAHDSELGDKVRSDPVSVAFADGGMYHMAARDHLRAAAHCLLAPKAIYPTFVLGRASIEAAAFGAWLLDPAITVEVRVSRGFEDRCWQLNQARLLTEAGVGDESKQEAKSQEDQLEEIFQSGRRHNLTEKTTGAQVARSRPSALDRIGEHLAADGLTQRGEWIFRMLSAPTHSTPRLVREFGRDNPILDLDDGRRIRQQGRSLDKAMVPVAVAIRSLQTVERAAAEVMGWDSSDDLIRPVLAAIVAALPD